MSINAEAERLGVTPEDLLDFYRGLKPLHQPALACPECDKEYKTESGLRSHVNDKHQGGEEDARV
jgi:hypothetical protein